MTGLHELDWNALIQLLTGSVGGMIGGWVTAYFMYKREVKAAQDLSDAQNSRIAALEKQSAECDARYTMLLQHVLTKG